MVSLFRVLVHGATVLQVSHSDKSILGVDVSRAWVDIRLPRSASSHEASTVHNSSELIGCTPSWGPLSPSRSHCIAPLWEHTGRQ